MIIILYLCQCVSAIWTITGTNKGKVICLYVFKIVKKKSFSKKHIALSATYKWGPAIHFNNLLNNLLINGSNLVISQTSNTSTNSVKNITSFTEFPNGQYLNNPSTNYNNFLFN